MGSYESIVTKGYSGIQSAKSQYRKKYRRNTRSGRNTRTLKDDASGVDHPYKARDKVGDIFVLGSIQYLMQHKSKHTSKHV